MLRLVTSQPENDGEGQDQEPCQRRQSSILGEYDKRREIIRVVQEVQAGTIRTLKKAMAMLGLKGIKFEEPETELKKMNNEYLRDLATLFEEKDDTDPMLKQARSDLRRIESRPIYPRVLITIDAFERQHRNAPYFKELKKRIGAIRAIKRHQLILSFKRKLADLSKQYDWYTAIQFKESFFPTEYEEGCGLKIEDLNPSASERMLLNQIRMQEDEYEEGFNTKLS